MPIVADILAPSFVDVTAGVIGWRGRRDTAVGKTTIDPHVLQFST